MNERLSQLLTELNRTGFLRLDDAAARLGVTTMTIRRDFRLLEADGYIFQVKNGAIPRQKLPEMRYDASRPSSKHKLARELAGVLSPRDVVLLSAGTTALACAQVLAALNAELSVLTYSLPVASALFQSRCHVILMGGELRSNSLDLLGPLTEANLRQYHVNYLVTGCDGADAETGFFTTDLNLANLERISATIADHVVVVTESAKFKRKSMVRFLELDNTDLLITDRNLRELDRQLLSRRPNLTLKLV